MELSLLLIWQGCFTSLGVMLPNWRAELVFGNSFPAKASSNYSSIFRQSQVGRTLFRMAHSSMSLGGACSTFLGMQTRDAESRLKRSSPQLVTSQVLQFMGAVRESFFFSCFPRLGLAQCLYEVGKHSLTCVSTNNPGNQIQIAGDSINSGASKCKNEK